MTAYILPPAQHSQLKEAVAYGHYLGAYEILKAMKPSEPTAFLIEFENGETELHFHDANNSLGESHTALYAMETKT